MVFLPAVRAAQGGIEDAGNNTPPAAPHTLIPTASAAAAGPGPSSIASSSRFPKPNVAMPPPHGPVIRKQNIACDACRTRKIRCQRTTIDEVCEQCATKGSACTSVYVEQLANSKSQKRAGKRRRKSETEEEVLRDRGIGGPTTHLPQQPATAMDSARTSPSPVMVGPQRSTSSARSRTSSIPAPPNRSASQLQHELIRYLFASEAVRHSQWDYNDTSSIRQCDLGESDLWEEMGGQVWKEAPSTAHAALDDDSLQELADELLDSFFSIVHIRYPLFETEQFRARFSDPDCHPDGPLCHPLLAAALAWGARFSETPTLVVDREEVSSRDVEMSAKGFLRSRMVQLVIIRAREVGEVCKAFRYAKLENIQLGILMEPLLAQGPFLKDRYEPSSIVYASRHFTSLGLNSSSGLLAISDAKKREEALVAWRLLTVSDGYRSMFNRLRPALSDGYFDVDLQQVQSPVNLGAGIHSLQRDSAGNNGDTTSGGSAREAWYTATQAGSVLCRHFCDQLWTPRVREKGISIRTLVDLADSNARWRDTHLFKLGVPAVWPDDWDFLAAITACSTDVYYHCLWLVVMRAIKDFGILDDEAHASTERIEILDRYKKEADHGAMRIAALAAVLTENGYLKLDPLVIYHPIYEAGLYLAAQAKEECLICVAGLRQYSIPFPCIWVLAAEIEALYISAQASLADQAVTGTEGSSAPTNQGPIAHAAPTDEHANRDANSAWFADQFQQADTKEAPPPPALRLSSNGSLPDVWPDGTPVPSRDVAWTLFDWLHQM